MSTKPKTRKTPSYPGLAIEPAGDLSTPVQNAIDDYHADCLAFEAAEAKLQSDRRNLVENAETEWFGDFVDRARVLELDRWKLESELLALRWRRYRLLSSMLTDYQTAADRAALHYNEVLEATIAQMRERGADAGVPSSGNQLTSGDSRFMPPTDAAIVNAARQQIPVTEAAGWMNRAEAALEKLKHICTQLPAESECEIEWHAIDPHYEIAEIVIDAIASPEPVVALTEIAQRVREMLGLQNTALNVELVDTLERIASTVPLRRGWELNLTGHDPEISKRLLPLLEKLPHSEAVRRIHRWLWEDLAALAV